MKAVADELARMRENDFPISWHTGMLLMDGKGALPYEMRALVDIMIEPGVAFNPIEGLSATDLTAAILEISVDPKQREGQNSFFVTSAEQMLRHFAVFYEAFIFNMARVMNPERMEYRWNLADMWEVFQMLRLVEASPNGKELENAPDALGMIEWLRDGKVLAAFGLSNESPEFLRHPMAGSGGLLDAAIEYIQSFPKTMGDVRLLGSVWSTLQSWIDPLMAHEDLVPWSRMTTGLNVTDCLRGKIVGINLPAYKYGTAGRLIQALGKQRITNMLRRRGDDTEWQKRGDQGPVVIMMDEFQEFVSQTEAAMLPVARSLGARYVCSTQNIDGLFAKLGHDGGKQFCDNFRSFVATGECSEATRHWISDRLGVGSVYKVNANKKAVDYDTTLTMMAGSPLNDPTHELAREMRVLKRAGAGLLAHSGIDTKGRTGAWQGQKLKSNMERNDLVESVLSSGVYEDGPWLTQFELSRFLAEPNIALAQVMRGGVKRRDIIALNPIYEGQVKPRQPEPAGVDESQSVSNVEGVVTPANRSDNHD